MIGMDVEQLRRCSSGDIDNADGQVRARVACALLGDAIYALADRCSGDRIDGQPDVLLRDNSRRAVGLGTTQLAWSLPPALRSKSTIS